jgi:hypothetical protein
MMARYPAFLKREPLIWGISLSDIFKLTSFMFVGSIFNVSQEVILISIASIYCFLVIVRKLFPRRHLEFCTSKKERLPLYLEITNSKKKLT